MIMGDANRTLARRWIGEAWNRRREDAIDEPMAPNAVGHIEGAGTRGPAEFRKMRDAPLAAFPDLELVVDDTLAEGNHVVVRRHVSGTHGGDGFGPKAAPRPADRRGMAWLRSARGKLVEDRDAWNRGEPLESLQAASAMARART
jgi:hypothetical protein